MGPHQMYRNRYQDEEKHPDKEKICFVICDKKLNFESAPHQIVEELGT